MTALVLVLLAQTLNLNQQPIEVRDEGVRQGTTRAYAINCSGTGVTCTNSAGVMTLTTTGGAAPPVDGGFVYWGTNTTGSTNERKLATGNYTTIDVATVGEVQVDWAHGQTCSSGQALTSSGTTALVCTSTLTASDVACSGTCVADAEIAAMAASKLTGTVAVTKGGTGLATLTTNQVLVGTAADTLTAKTLPSCSGATTDKLLYDNATQTFSCGADQGGAGGGISFAEAAAAKLAGAF